MSTEPGRLTLVPGGDPSAGATYPAIPASSIAHVDIFPAVGIARFGDSQREFFYAYEVPGHTDLPAGVTTFRDVDQRIRRQAVRFRVYAYDAQHNLLGEVNGNNGYNLTWTAHVANTKGAHTQFRGRFDDPNPKLRNPGVARSRLIIDPGRRSISTSTKPNFVNLRGIFQGSNNQVTDNNHVYLGQLQVDDAGRLIVVPGTGEARSVTNPTEPQPELTSEFDNNDWFDTACDGWVRVHVTAEGFNMGPEHAATVICGPPHFAWGINMHASLYDIMENIYPLSREGYDFERDIWPVLTSASLLSWTNNFADNGHGPNTSGHFTSADVINILKNGTPEQIRRFKANTFNRLRRPDYEDPSQATLNFMPQLSGDAGYMLEGDIRRFAALTRLQYERFRAWTNDANFRLPPEWPPQLKSRIEDIRLQGQPDHLTRASVESTIGDATYPGIEIYWIAKAESTYNLDVPNLVPPFRINHASVEPGHLTNGLSLPWQSDFFMCRAEPRGRPGEPYHPWWPSIRPDNVIPYEGPTQRSDWTRGFRKAQNVGDLRPNTDMVRHWSALGIVREVRVSGQVVYVERERRAFNPGD